MTKMAEISPAYIFETENDDYIEEAQEKYERHFYDYSRNYEDAC